jgi:hypothetical protein
MWKFSGLTFLDIWKERRFSDFVRSSFWQVLGQHPVPVSFCPQHISDRLAGIETGPPRCEGGVKPPEPYLDLLPPWRLCAIFKHFLRESYRTQCAPTSNTECYTRKQQSMWESLGPHSYTFFPLWHCSPARAMASSFTTFLDHTQRRATVGRTPPDEWSARRRDLYLTSQNTHNKHQCPRWDSDYDGSRRAAVNLCLRPGVFNAWPAGHMWPEEPFAVARRPFWKNNYPARCLQII